MPWQCMFAISMCIVWTLWKYYNSSVRGKWYWAKLPLFKHLRCVALFYFSPSAPPANPWFYFQPACLPFCLTTCLSAFYPAFLPPPAFSFFSPAIDPDYLSLYAAFSLSLSLLPSFSPSAPPDKFPIPFLPVCLPSCPFSTCFLASLPSSPLCLQPTCLCSGILTCLLLFSPPVALSTLSISFVFNAVFSICLSACLLVCLSVSLSLAVPSQSVLTDMETYLFVYFNVV